MPSFARYLIVAILLVAVGFVLWSAAYREERLVQAERELVSLQFERATAALDELAQPAPLARLVPNLDLATGVARVRSMREYWLSNYETVSSDATFALMAANAAFRAVESEGGPWGAVVGKLDAVVKRYAEVLRNEPESEDAAYNFEFVVRRRAAVAAAKQAVPPLNVGATVRTLHGQAGAPPTAADMKQFKMIVPMLPQEREEAEQAGRGTRRIRKG